MASEGAQRWRSGAGTENALETTRGGLRRVLKTLTGERCCAPYQIPHRGLARSLVHRCGAFAAVVTTAKVVYHSLHQEVRVERQWKRLLSSEFGLWRRNPSCCVS